MSTLILTPNLSAPDDVYAALLEAHEGLTPKESAALNARLILLLVNHLGDADLLSQALDAARRVTR